jgi:hypothetical protein
LRNFLQEYGPDSENNSLEQILLLSAAYLLQRAAQRSRPVDNLLYLKSGL